MDSKFKSFIIHILRRGHYKWAPKGEALTAARVSRGVYKCAKCSLTFKKKMVNVDHIQPVIPVKEGFTDFDTYIKRLFVPKELYQILCINCHDAKSGIENHQRKAYKSRPIDKKKIVK